MGRIYYLPVLPATKFSRHSVISCVRLNRNPLFRNDRTTLERIMTALDQKKMFYTAGKKIAALNELFTDMIRNNEITKADLEKLIEKRPHVYGRFSGYLATLPD